MKEKIHEYINRQMPRLIEIADSIYDKAELGHEEYSASKLIAEYLSEHGLVDAVLERKDLKDYLAAVLRFFIKQGN